MSSALPPNVTPLEEAIEEMARALDLGVDLAQLMSPDRCPEAFLPFLAWHLSADDWSNDWSLPVRREIVRRAVEVHRVRGTLGAVKAALLAAGFADARVYEAGSAIRYDGTYSHDGAIAYQPGGHWAEFQVRVPRPMTVEQASEVRRLVERAAPASRHLTELSYPLAQSIYDGTARYDGSRNYGGTAFG